MKSTLLNILFFFWYFCSSLQEVQGKSKKKQSSKVNSKSSSSVTSVLCSFLLATFLLFGVTGALIGYDTYRAGGKFEASFTGQTLKQAGLLPAVQDAWTCTMKYSARGYKWAETNVPVYYQATSKVSRVSSGIDVDMHLMILSFFLFSFTCRPLDHT